MSPSTQNKVSKLKRRPTGFVRSGDLASESSSEDEKTDTVKRQPKTNTQISFTPNEELAKNRLPSETATNRHDTKHYDEENVLVSYMITRH